MIGRESDGTIEFAGTLSSLSFTVTGGEFWNGFTIGTVNSSTVPPTVPEPETFVMVGTGILGLLGAAREKLRTRF